MTQPFADLVKELAHQKGWSIERLGHEAWDPEPRTGTSPALLRKVLSGQRTLTPALIEAIARALDVDARVFAEYRLAMARRLLDERPEPDGVGLEVAMEHLSQVEAALRAAPAGRAARRAGRPGDSQRQTSETRPGDRRLREAGGPGDA